MRERTLGYIESERRQTTVMFADISGFTALSERIDPEEVTALLNNCFSMMEEVIHHYDGTIDKFIGDCAMVLFGAPTAIENAPQKAVNTAIEIKNRLKQFNRDNNMDVPLKVHIGINTGIVLAGMIGGEKRRDYTVMGDTVNISSRLESTATPGQILVGPATYNATKERFEYKAKKDISLKGREIPVPVYELLSEKEKPFRSAQNANRMIFSRLVGRENEIEILKARVKRAVQGKGSIINIIGEAGIGKTRLIAELKNQGGMTGTVLLRGRSTSIGRNLSFHPLVDMLRNWARINDDDSDLTAVNKLGRAVKAVDSEAVDEVLPFLATLMGMHLPERHATRIKGIAGEALEKLIMMNIRELVIKGTDIKTVIIWMDDLHWADASSIELLETFFRLVKKHGILFINSFRPGYMDTGERIIKNTQKGYADYYTEIRLKPLGKQKSIELVNNLLNIRGLPLNVRERILQRSGGNPFFIEEVVRSFIDEGVVALKNGVFKVTGKIDKAVVPLTISDVLMSRIDRLDEKTKQVVKIASVIGRNFFYSIISEVAAEIDGIDDHLMYLRDIQFIIEREKMDETAYCFKHALAQEAAYESILIQNKKRLHLSTAGAIEKVFKDRLNEFYGMLAYHYSSGEDMDKAEEYMVKAGEEALKSAALNEALHYYREGLKIYMIKYGFKADPEKISMMEKNIALALFNKGQHAEAVEHFESAMAHMGVKQPGNRILGKLIFILYFLDFLISLFCPMFKWKGIPSSRDVALINLFHKKLQALSIIDPTRMFIESFYLLNMLSRFDLTRVDNGVGILSGASYSFSWPGISFYLSRKITGFVKNKVDRNDTRERLYFELADLFPNFYTGRWKKGYDVELVNSGMRIGEIHLASIYISFNGRICIEQGNFNKAKRMIDILNETGELYEHDFPIALKHILKTKLFVKFRRIERALEEADAGINFISATDFKPILFVQYALKARAYVFTGNIKKAENTLRQAAEIKHEANIVPQYLSYYYLTAFMLHLSILDRAAKQGSGQALVDITRKARTAGKKAVRIAGKVASDRTEAYRLMGNLFQHMRKRGKALKWWRKSITAGEQIGADLELSRAYFTAGQHILASGHRYGKQDDAEAKRYKRKAELMFKKMGLVHEAECSWSS